MDYSFFALNSLFLPSMYQGVPYIDSKGVMKGRIRVISRHMQGQESIQLDPRQGKLQKDLDFVHIFMYAFLEIKPTYIREKGFKSCVQQFKHVFRDDIGNIKGIKKVHWGPKSLQRDRGRPYKCDSHGVVKSAITLSQLKNFSIWPWGHKKHNNPQHILLFAFYGNASQTIVSLENCRTYFQNNHEGYAHDKF